MRPPLFSLVFYCALFFFVGQDLVVKDVFFWLARIEDGNNDWNWNKKNSPFLMTGKPHEQFFYFLFATVNIRSALSL